MKLDKIIYDVREGLNQFSDDSEIDDRYIIYLYNIKRSKYLRQELNNFNRTFPLSVQQKICMEMEEVSIDECNQDLECEKILKSVKPLPKTLELHTKSSLVNIKPTNKVSVPFSYINKERLSMIDGAPYSKSIYSFLDSDNHLYIYSKGEEYKFIECLSVSGIFEDPLELSKFKDCCKCKEAESCYDEMTSDYPLQPHLIDLIRNEIVQQLVAKLQIPEDKTNDSND